MQRLAVALTLEHGACHRRDLVTAGESAIAEAVRAHDALLLATARRLCRNASDADDLVHDTYERALRSWERYADRGNLKSWLMTILHNLFIDRCRKAKREPDPIGDVEVPAPEPAAAPAWVDVTAEQMARALGELGPEFRAVYDLHVAGRSYDQIAAELKIAKPTVGTRLVRARHKLKDALLRELGRAR